MAPHILCYRTVPSRASGTPCASVFGLFVFWHRILSNRRFRSAHICNSVPYHTMRNFDLVRSRGFETISSCHWYRSTQNLMRFNMKATCCRPFWPPNFDSQDRRFRSAETSASVDSMFVLFGWFIGWLDDIFNFLWWSPNISLRPIKIR